MEKRKELYREFFERYAESFRQGLEGTADVERTADLYASCFIAADPNGVYCGKNGDEFRKSLPQGYQYYQGIGVTAMNLVSVATTLLDEFHAMCRVTWRCEYNSKRAGRGTLSFSVIYFLQTRQGDTRVFGYITGDEQKATREAGLI